METVLIADDEVNIREGLKIIIDWNELGFEICGRPPTAKRLFLPSWRRIRAWSFWISVCPKCMGRI